MSNITPFESKALPAAFNKAVSLFGLTTDLASGGGAGFKMLSIKGKVFHIVDGDARQLVTKPDAPDEPAASLNVVILKGNPNKSKVFYVGGYSEGADTKPTCFSNDGIAPDAQAQEPQAKQCATCPHNVWGSKITEDGRKARACGDSKRLAVAPAGQLNDPLLLRVPGASLKALDQFQDQLAKRGVPYQMVVCKVGFDYTVAHPQLTFKPIDFVTDDDALKTIKEQLDSDVVEQIIGLKPSAVPVVDDDHVPAPSPKVAAPADEEFEQPAPAPAAKAPAKAKKSAALDAALATAPAPTASVKVEGEGETPAPAAAAPAKKATIVEVDDADFAGLDDLLAGFGDDD